MEIILMLAIAIAIDLTLGDPPDAVHPVAWMGKVIAFLEKGGKNFSHQGQFFYGMGITLFTLALFVIPVYLLLAWLNSVNQVAYIIVGGVLLKFTFSIKGLRSAALKVRRLLQDKKLSETRFEMRALVSRDTKELSEPLIVSAAVESVAEGTGDSLVAPLFFFLFLGVPGAIGYRVVNTLDSMIGYRGKYEYLGKFAARLDDVLNLIPARLAAMMLILAAITRRSGRNAWHLALHEHVLTRSPNAGWPMAAVAGALNVCLEKPGNYKLGEAKAALVPATINDALTLFIIAASAWLLLCFLAGGIYFAVTA
jgi:adenosylcobinamide-phosphate synthase